MNRLGIYVYAHDDTPDGETPEWHCLGYFSRDDVFEKVLTSSLDLVLVCGFKQGSIADWTGINRVVANYNTGMKLCCVATRYLMEKAGWRESFAHIPVKQHSGEAIGNVLYQFTPSFMDVFLGDMESLTAILTPRDQDIESTLKEHNADAANLNQGNWLHDTIDPPAQAQWSQQCRPLECPESAYEWFLACFEGELADYLQFGCRATQWSLFIEQTLNGTIRVEIARVVSAFVHQCISSWVIQTRAENHRLRPQNWSRFVVSLAQAAPPWERGNLPIQDVRIINALARQHVKSIADLAAINPQQLMRTPNMGERSLKMLTDHFIRWHDTHKQSSAST